MIGVKKIVACAAILSLVTMWAAAPAMTQENDAACVGASASCATGASVSAAKASVVLQVNEESACCATEVAATTTAKVSSEDSGINDLLRNATDPLSGLPTRAEYFLDYADEDSKVFARIYFGSRASVEQAKAGDVKQLYERVYLTLPGGDHVSYGEARLAIDNKVCAVSGVGAAPGRKGNFDTDMSVNCTAGGCSLGDGFKVNFNGASVGVCCPTCRKEIVARPSRFLPNIEPEIVAAFGKERTTDS